MTDMRNPSDAARVRRRLRVRRPLGAHPVVSKPSGTKAQPIRLACTCSRKVGEPNYGSRGASAEIEVELSPSLDPDVGALHAEIKKLFGIVRTAVDDELHVGKDASCQESIVGHQSTECRGVTDRQRRAIERLCHEQDLDVDAEVHRRWGRNLSRLTIVEASGLIDDLKRMERRGPSQEDSS